MDDPAIESGPCPGSAHGRSQNSTWAVPRSPQCAPGGRIEGPSSRAPKHPSTRWPGERVTGRSRTRPARPTAATACLASPPAPALAASGAPKRDSEWAAPERRSRPPDRRRECVSVRDPGTAAGNGIGADDVMRGLLDTRRDDSELMTPANDRALVCLAGGGDREGCGRSGAVRGPVYCIRMRRRHGSHVMISVDGDGTAYSLTRGRRGGGLGSSLRPAGRPHGRVARCRRHVERGA